MPATQTRAIRSAAAISALALVQSAGLAQDTRPAPFPEKAAAVLVSGSGGAGNLRFGKDIDKMTDVFTNNAFRWKYTSNGAGFVQTLKTDSAGDSKSTFANVGKAVDSAGKSLWTTASRNQNFVYVHSSHGTGNTNKSSNISFENGEQSSDAVWKMIRDQMPDGHTQYSKDGTTDTTCVRTMTYMLQPCFSGGMIHDLTVNLSDKALRRKHFPFLSDITVMTAADSNECSYGQGDDGANHWMKTFYGGINDAGNPIPGILKDGAAHSAWDVYKYAAENDIRNPQTNGYAISAFGAGETQPTRYQKGANYGTSANKEHPLYRHVSFYPSLTFGDTVDGRVDVAPGNNSFDFRLGSADAPFSGAVPITLELTSTTAGHINVDRDMYPDAGLGALTDPSQFFLQYYSFDITPTGVFVADAIGLTLAVEFDDILNMYAHSDIHLFHSAGSGWSDTNAAFDIPSSTFTLEYGSLYELGTFAVVVPEPGSIALASLGGLLALRRRRA